MVKDDGHIVLGDFGFACSLDVIMPPESHVSGSFDSDEILEPVSTDICGTLPYMAPEVLCGMEYSCSVDWFSYGVFLYVFHLNKVRSVLSPISSIDHLNIVSLAGLVRESNELSEGNDVNAIKRDHFREQVVRRPLEEGRSQQFRTVSSH